MTITRAGTVIAKSDQVRQALAEGRDIDALRIAKGFRALGPHKTTIQRGWDALQNPGFHRQLRRDPEQLVRAAVAALRTLYPVKSLI